MFITIFVILIILPYYASSSTDLHQGIVMLIFDGFTLVSSIETDYTLFSEGNKEKLRKKLGDAGVLLSEDFEVLPKKENSEWRIIDRDKNFLIVREEDEGDKKSKLNVYDLSKPAPYRGTGIILDINDNEIYILTAYHLMEDAKTIKVKFFQQQNENFGAEFSGEHVDESLDMAVITVNPNKERFLDKLKKITFEEKVKLLGEISLIGNSGDRGWKPNINNYVSVCGSEECFEISGSPIDGGYSGGPVFNENSYLIGMFLGKGGENKALKICHIINKLDIWKIPHRFLDLYTPKYLIANTVFPGLGDVWGQWPAKKKVCGGAMVATQIVTTYLSIKYYTGCKNSRREYKDSIEFYNNQGNFSNYSEFKDYRSKMESLRGNAQTLRKKWLWASIIATIGIRLISVPEAIFWTPKANICGEDADANSSAGGIPNYSEGEIVLLSLKGRF